VRYDFARDVAVFRVLDRYFLNDPSEARLYSFDSEEQLRQVLTSAGFPSDAILSML